jgi:ATP-binding cassette, subfamily F, member 3
MLIRAWAVSKSFGPKEVLKEVTFNIDEKARVAIVGPNGVGKSTLLRVLMGELAPDVGEVVRRTNHVCYMSQFPQYDPEQSVVDSVSGCVQSSGAIGKRMRELEQMMLQPGPEVDMDQVAMEYGQLQEEFNNADSFDDMAQVKETLAKVGLPDDRLEKKVSELSGGERTKVMLAKVLMQADESDLLVLDEPTSHLDMAATEWLEDYLLQYPGAVVVVSHDRYFLDRTVTNVIDLEDGVVRQFSGNYTDYVAKKRLDIERRRIAAEKYETEKQRLEDSAVEMHQKEWYKSKHKTRMKMVDRLEEAEPPKKRPEFNFKVETKERSGKNVITAKGLHVKRGDKMVLDGLDLEIEVGDKLGIFGANGSGKTTLMKTILGELPFHGEMWLAPGAVIGYFGQGHDQLNPELTPEDHLLESLGHDARVEARRLLARFYLRSHEVQRPISTLSGGERARVALAMLLAERRNLLLLDEPTNYLDIQARQAVEGALMDYQGTMLIITHDRYLLNTVCNMVGEMRAGSITVFPGTYSQYRQKVKESTVSLEQAGVYKVVSGFTDWNTKTKYNVGDKVAVAPSELEKYRWAMESGKLKKVAGTELKKVRK